MRHGQRPLAAWLWGPLPLLRRWQVGMLVSMLGEGDRRQALSRDLALLIEKEVGAKAGLQAMAIQGAYKILRSAKPEVVERAVTGLLPDFALALEPLCQAAEADMEGGRFERLFARRATEVAEALLSVTDARMQRASTGPLRAAYARLRASAHRHVSEAAPRIGALLDRHHGEGGPRSLEVGS